MRWSRKQFSMRLMMAFIAISGLAMGGFRLKSLRDHYRDQAARQAHYFSNLNDMIESQRQYIEVIEGSLDRIQRALRIQRGPAHTNILPSLEDCEQRIKEGKTKVEKGHLDLDLFSQRAEYDKRLNIKYERASQQPWIFIEPDETPPPLPTPPQSPK